MAVSLDPWVNVVEVGWEARLGLSLTNVPGGLASWEWIGPTTAMTSAMTSVTASQSISALPQSQACSRASRAAFTCAAARR